MSVKKILGKFLSNQGNQEEIPQSTPVNKPVSTSSTTVVENAGTLVNNVAKTDGNIVDKTVTPLVAPVNKPVGTSSTTVVENAGTPVNDVNKTGTPATDVDKTVTTVKTYAGYTGYGRYANWGKPPYVVKTYPSYFNKVFTPVVPPKDANLLVVVLENSNIMAEKKDELTEVVSKVLKRESRFQFVKAFTYSNNVTSEPICDRSLYKHNLTFEGVPSLCSSVVKVSEEVNKIFNGKTTEINNEKYIFKSCKIVFVGSGDGEFLSSTAESAITAVKTMRDNGIQTEFITFYDKGVMVASLLGFREIQLMN